MAEFNIEDFDDGEFIRESNTAKSKHKHVSSTSVSYKNYEKLSNALNIGLILGMLAANAFFVYTIVGSVLN